jgi:opacity protein-like surface antigen
MSNSTRKCLVRNLGLAAAAGSALLGAPVLAAPELTGTAPQIVAQASDTMTVDVVEVESVNGWYLTVGAGAVWPQDQQFRGRDLRDWSPLPRTPHGELNYNGGFSVDGGLGYDFGALRAELTYGYSAPSLDSYMLRNYNGYSQSAGGKINKNDVMASLYWDVIPFGRFTPYIGGGLGYTNISTPNFSVRDYNTGSVNKGLLGWQAKVGVSYALAYNWDVYAEGTYSGATDAFADKIKLGNWDDFGAKLGFRYRFAQPVVVVIPEPEPAPAPAPAPAPIPAPEPAPAPEPIRGLW